MGQSLYHVANLVCYFGPYLPPGIITIFSVITFLATAFTLFGRPIWIRYFVDLSLETMRCLRLTNVSELFSFLRMLLVQKYRLLKVSKITRFVNLNE